MLHSTYQQIWKTQQWPQDWNRSVFIPIPKKGMPKNVQTTTQLHSSHTLVKQCSKFSKLGFNSKWTKNSQMFKLGLEKVEEPEIKLPTSVGSYKKQENSRKKKSASLTMLKPLTLQSQSLLTSQQTMESSSTDRNTRPSYLPPERQKGMTEDEMVGWHHRLNGYEFSKLQEMVKDREAWHDAVHGIAKSWTWLSDWPTTTTQLVSGGDRI